MLWRGLEGTGHFAVDKWRSFMYIDSAGGGNEGELLVQVSVNCRPQLLGIGGIHVLEQRMLQSVLDGTRVRGYFAVEKWWSFLCTNPQDIARQV
jgi:hypothetical protein